MIRLLHCNLEVMGLKNGNKLSACGGKVAYILPSPKPAMLGVLCTGPSFFF